MSEPSRFRRLVRLPRRRGAIDGDITDEIAHHLRETERELVAAGTPPEEARHEARRRFGDVDGVKQSLGSLDAKGERRRARGDFWDGVAHDVTGALRTLRREPAFAAIVALTLALGMGANATMFRILDRVFLRPAPHVRDDGSLSLLYFQRETPEFGRVTQTSQSYPVFAQLRERLAPLGDVAAWWITSVSSGTGGAARKLEVSFVTPNFLGMTGVRPYTGRFFPADAWRAQEEPAVVVTQAFAEQNWGVANAAVGQTLPIGPRTYRVIGVTPRGFVGVNLRPVDVFVPMHDGIADVVGKEWEGNKNVRWLQMVARRRPGVDPRPTSEAATIAVRDIGRALGKSDTLATVIAGSIVASRRPDGTAQGRIAVWLGGVSLLVLLVACANVANLILARTVRRRRELAVHLALGVSRARITRRLLGETLLLGILAGGAALILSTWGDGVLRATLLQGMPWESEIGDPRQAAFVALLAVVAALLAGVAPALVASRTDLMEALKSGIRDGGGRRRRLRTALVVVQGTLSVVLLVGAGLFVRSFVRASSLDFGFAPSGLLAVSPDISAIATSPEHFEQRFGAMAEAVRRVPGVAHVAQSVTVPFMSQWSKEIVIGGDTLPPFKGGGPYVNGVSHDYFRAMGTPIRRGRDFTAQDRAGSAPVAIVSEGMARAIWPGKDALGECFHTEATDGCVTVVGIVGDGRITELADAPPAQFWQPLGQWRPSMRSLFVRLDSSGAPSAEAIRRAILQVEPSLPYFEIREMRSVVGDQLQPWKLGATLFGLFGLLGLAVAALGLYSVVAHEVSQRSHEIGVRMALGARSGEVARLVMTSGVRQALAGVAVGIAIAWLAATRMSNVLFETSPRDPAVYLAVVAILIAVAVAASLIPARRAARTDPMSVLRDD